jgi:hypothetical protein
VVGEEFNTRLERRMKYGEGEGFALKDKENEEDIGLGLAG